MEAVPIDNSILVGCGINTLNDKICGDLNKTTSFQMKTLYILRHAKSSWDDPGLTDFSRPLNPRGRKAAAFMGELMAARGLIPDAILSSTATRAETTSQIVKESGQFQVDIQPVDQIYEASPQCLIETFSGIDDACNTALVIGHNPGIEGSVFFLTGCLEPMPTAALAVIDLDIEKWHLLGAGCGKLRQILRPREEMNK